MSGCVRALEGIIKKVDQKRKLEEEEKEQMELDANNRSTSIINTTNLIQI